MSECFQDYSYAKINLYLKVLGKRPDGYHDLQSYIMFADFGDVVTLSPSSDFNLHITGDFAHQLNDLSLKDNLVTKTATALAKLYNKPLDVKITLEKNIPLGTGMGGGSGNAGAVARLLHKYWGIKPKRFKPGTDLHDTLLKIGADVPACYVSKPVYVSGVGSVEKLFDNIPSIHVLSVFPHVFCETGKVFGALDLDETLIESVDHKAALRSPDLEGLKEANALVNFIKSKDNDLQNAAIHLYPKIQQCLDVINMQNGCVLSRMTGSGSSCFGLFLSKDAAQTASENIQKTYPDWWVKSGILTG